MKLIDLEEFERKLSLRCNTYDTRSLFVSSTILGVLNTMECVPIEKLADEIRAYCNAAEACVECPFWDRVEWCTLEGYAPCMWTVKTDEY